MRSRSSGSLPPRLQAGRQQFERWRGQRAARSRIPESLWRSAVKLADEFGVHRTAKTLRLNYGALKARVRPGCAESPSSEAPTKFVELVPGPGLDASTCVVELEDGHGARMHIHIEHADATLLAALTSAFVQR